MDINALLQGYACGCGKFHSCDIDTVSIRSGAIAQLAHVCGSAQSVLLVADENTFTAAGQATADALSGKQITQVIFPGTTVLIPNEDAIRAVQQKLGGAEMIVAIGSGVIQDLCKYVSHISGIPYCVVATAPSMDGYASNGAAMILGGMKVTVAAGLPRAILADTAVLAQAPMEMIRAGYGDIIGKFSALNDWKLSHCVNGEYFCRELYDLTMDMVTRTLALADGLVQRDPASIGVLMDALVVVGIAMRFAGSSRPASGSEHHFSHYFEITGILRDEPYLPHGIDVACSAVLTAQLRQKLLSTPWPNTQYRLSRDAYAATVSRIYGSIADSCIALQDKVGFYARDMVSIYKEKEQELRSILAQCPSPEEMEAMLRAVGMDMQEFYSLYNQEKLADAVLYAKELKDRYTVLWMHYDLFGGMANEADR